MPTSYLPQTSNDYAEAYYPEPAKDEDVATCQMCGVEMGSETVLLLCLDCAFAIDPFGPSAFGPSECAEARL